MIIPFPIGSMYAIYANIYHQYTPFMLAYIPAPWILWVIIPSYNPNQFTIVSIELPSIQFWDDFDPSNSSNHIKS